MEERLRKFGEWTLDHVGLSVLLAAFFGVLWSGLLVIVIRWLFCNWFHYTCMAAHKNPPWVILTGTAAAPSLLLTWYWRTRHKSNEVTTAQEQARIAQEQARIALEAQVTDRFVAAVKLLSETNTSARLGGVYALQRIAKDSDRDKPTVVKTLSAFVRDNVERPSDPEATEIPPYEKLNTDIEAALRVLKELGGAQLQDAHFIRANLISANLEYANLEGAYLVKANLLNANLHGANLHGANLQGANLISANLISANLISANLISANLWVAHLERANLKDAYYDSKTRFSGGFDPEAHGMKKVKEED